MPRRNRLPVVTEERLAIVARTWGTDTPYDAIHAELSATSGILPITRQLISKWARTLGINRHPGALNKQLAEIRKAMRPETIEAPPDREPILRRMANKDWPYERLVRLCELWEGSQTGSEIADTLHTTKNAVLGKAHRLINRGALVARPSPLKSPEPPKTGRERQPPAPVATLPPLASVDPPVKLKPITVPLPTAGFSPMRYDFRSSRPVVHVVPRFVADDGSSPTGPSRKPCQWVTRDGSVTEAWIFCGLGQIESRPYCGAYCKDAYIRIRERHDQALA